MYLIGKKKIGRTFSSPISLENGRGGEEEKVVHQRINYTEMDQQVEVEGPKMEVLTKSKGLG